MSPDEHAHQMKKIKKMKGWTMEQHSYNLFTFTKGNKKRGLYIDDTLADILGIIKKF